MIAALMVADLFLIFMWAPTELVMGHVQRIMYFHVALAWVAFLAFFLVFVGSIMYLWKRSAWWDALAQSAAEIGVVFATLILITGTIWMRPVWGVWWTWEPKLTTSVILWLMYVVYLMLRAYAPNRSQAATYSAVLGVIAFIDVPVVYFAARWWRSVHPEAVVGPPGRAREPGLGHAGGTDVLRAHLHSTVCLPPQGETGPEEYRTHPQTAAIFCDNWRRILNVG